MDKLSKADILMVTSAGNYADRFMDLPHRDGNDLQNSLGLRIIPNVLCQGSARVSVNWMNTTTVAEAI